jgi:hypothetical protein
LKGKGVSRAEIKAQLEHLLPIAKKQIMEQA